MNNTLDLMIYGIGLGYFVFYVICPLIGWLFNLGPKPTQIPPIDHTERLETTRKWLSSLNDDDNLIKGFFENYHLPDKQK